MSSRGREQLMKTIHHSDNTELQVDEDGVLRHVKRLWVPKEQDLRKEILKEANSLAYLIYPGSTKMYNDLK